MGYLIWIFDEGSQFIYDLDVLLCANKTGGADIFFEGYLFDMRIRVVFVFELIECCDLIN